MRRRETQTIGDVLREVLHNQHLDGKLNETRLLNAWPEVLGPAITKYTGEAYIKNKVLYVKIASSVLRNELMMSREKLINSLNERVGAKVITDIRFN
jgi:predicted nucleic acid-binding Zn ribbon protein